MSAETTPASDDTSSHRPRRAPPRRVGVCSWSLQPASLFQPASSLQPGSSSESASQADCSRDLAEKVRATGLDCLQLALGPAGLERATVTDASSTLARAGIEIRSGMLSMEGEDYSTIDSIRRTGGVRSDERWPANLERARRAAELAEASSIPLVTLHAGFMPEDRRDPERRKLVDRLRVLAETFAARGVRVGLETGQERAETLLEVLDEIGAPTVGVNFDPANMILYGTGDPVDALALLAPRVVQVHVKDARPPRREGEWGEEVVVGTGAVDWRRFFDVLDTAQPAVDLMIERESGTQRVADIVRAREFLQSLVAAESMRT